MNVELARLLLKKITIQVGSGQSILHLSAKQQQITDLLQANNNYLKIDNIENFYETWTKSKSFTYVITDFDQIDNIDKFLDKIPRYIIRPGLLIGIVGNLCTWENKVNILFNNAPNCSGKSYAPNYIRNLLITKGYFLKNRFWSYGDKMLFICDIPVSQ